MILKSFRFWVYLNAALWFAGFFALHIWLLLAFDDAAGSTLNGVTREERAAIRDTFFEVYLPYLGIIIGSAAALNTKKTFKSKSLEILWPIVILILGLFFNFLFIKSFFDFVQNESAAVTPFLDDLHGTAKWMALLVAAPLSRFFDLGFK